MFEACYNCDNGFVFCVYPGVHLYIDVENPRFIKLVQGFSDAGSSNFLDNFQKNMRENSRLYLKTLRFFPNGEDDFRRSHGEKM